MTSNLDNRLCLLLHSVAIPYSETIIFSPCCCISLQFVFRNRSDILVTLPRLTPNSVYHSDSPSQITEHSFSLSLSFEISTQLSELLPSHKIYFRTKIPSILPSSEPIQLLPNFCDIYLHITQQSFHSKSFKILFYHYIYTFY